MLTFELTTTSYISSLTRRKVITDPERHDFSKIFFDPPKNHEIGLRRYDRSGSQICFRKSKFKHFKNPEWPSMIPLTHQWTPSKHPMTTNDNQLGHFWFPDVVKWNFTFKFLKEPIFPQFYPRNFCINSQYVLNFLVFFHKKTPTKN